VNKPIALETKQGGTCHEKYQTMVQYHFAKIVYAATKSPIKLQQQFKLKPFRI
jgi:hypothetical protein